MYMAQPGHIDQIKQVNTGRVYKLIDQFGPISRIDLSKLSGLAPASITKISRELMEGHLIHETVVQESISRGRPAVGLQTDNAGWQFLSIRLGKGYLIIALHELGGNVVADYKVEIEETDQVALQQRILTEIEQFFASHAHVVERMTSIAVTLPALVNFAEGIVLQMPYFNIENLALGPAIYEKTGVPVFIANDTCAWALAEMLFGQSQEVDNSLLISNHQGVAAGVILNGRLAYSRNGNIGELGHIQVDPDGMLCECGKHGCLDTVASSEAVCRKVEQALRQGQKSMIPVSDVSMERICEAALKGDELAKNTIEQLGKDLGKGIAIMVNIFSPEKILLGGALNHAKSLLYPAIEKSLQQYSLPIFHKNVPLVECKFFTQTTMPGAALIKQALYDGSLLLKVSEG
ncbi:sugar metabolism global transcriptional regulator Mlc [Vibrio rumoiensis]|uniref:Transcriptional regulator n=1 Tax=Vibrio rumoiensis 1S-45 TaxID=1188252 RepID=A0A1E5E435_9VIBR|nr:ROK family protein [Vibrio rumoiensis]OEF26918.1 transcriptional regulator [Vibrio rumoiensis 1S-45]